MFIRDLIAQSDRSVSFEFFPPKTDEGEDNLLNLIKTELDLPYTEIGALFGGRDHSTVIHSVNKVQADMAADAEFRSRVHRLQDDLRR